MSAVRLKVARLGQKGLRTVITGLVKQVLQVLKKPENKTKIKKFKSLGQGVKGKSKIPIGYLSVKDWTRIINAAEFSRACEVVFQSNPS